jgi:hypothetical protein
MSTTSGLSLVVLAACAAVGGAPAVPTPEVEPAAACKAMAGQPNESPRRSARTAFPFSDRGSDRFRVQMRVLRGERGELIAICEPRLRTHEAVALAPRADQAQGPTSTEANQQREVTKEGVV